MALGSDQQLNIIIKARDEATGVLNKVKGSMENMQPAFRTMAAVGTAAFAGIAVEAKKAISMYAEVERSNRQLSHAVIDVSKGTQKQVDDIKAISAALQKKVGIDADSLDMGAAQLSTFGLQSDSVVALTKSLADFTVNQDGVNASSDQYVQNANTMAKALNGQFGILEKSGIRFTETQQNMILFGTETEKVAALQEGLNQNLRETTDTVGGLDVAQAKLKRTMEDMHENIGSALAPVFEMLVEKIQPVIEKFSEWATNNPELLGKIILIAGAVAGLSAGLGLIGIALPAIIGGFTLLMGPVGLVVGAIAGFILIIQKLNEIMKFTRDDWGLIWDGIVITIKEKINGIVALAEGMANGWVMAVNFIIKALNKIQFSIPDWVPKIGGKSFGINIPLMDAVSLPRYEQGGTIPGARGTAVPILAHGGEQIIPARNTGGTNGTNIEVVLNYPSFKNQEDVETVKRQVEAAFRDVTRVYKLQPS